MPSSWKIDIDSDRIAWLTCDMPGTSTNVLSAAVIKDLSAALPRSPRQKPRGVVISSAKPSGFIAGADIKEFQDIHTPEEGYSLVRAGQVVFDHLEALPCPRSRPSMDSRWGEAWSSRSRPPTGWAPTMPSSPWGCPR